MVQSRHVYYIFGQNKKKKKGHWCSHVMALQLQNAIQASWNGKWMIVLCEWMNETLKSIINSHIYRQIPLSVSLFSNKTLEPTKQNYYFLDVFII